MKTIEEIRRLMVDGEIVRAGEAAKELLDAEPDNLQAKMLYGTCRQLLGDEETFKRIHDEIMMKLENEDETELQPGTVSLWKKYHALWMTLIVGGLVLAGAGATVMYFGKYLFDNTSGIVGAANVNADYVNNLYAGPSYYGIKEGAEEISVKFSDDSDVK